MTDLTLGQEIERTLRRISMTRAQFAGRVSVHPSTISRIVNDEHYTVRPATERHIRSELQRMGDIGGVTSRCAAPELVVRPCSISVCSNNQETSNLIEELLGPLQDEGIYVGRLTDREHESRILVAVIVSSTNKNETSNVHRVAAAIRTAELKGRPIGIVTSEASLSTLTQEEFGSWGQSFADDSSGAKVFPLATNAHVSSVVFDELIPWILETCDTR